MNISCEVTPGPDGYDYKYLMPIHDESGAKLMPIFGSDFDAPNLFTQVGVDEYTFTGKFYYTPNNLKGFGFHSNLPPSGGEIILRSVTPAPGMDYTLDSTVPVPESGWLMLIPMVWAALLRRKRPQAGL